MWHASGLEPWGIVVAHGPDGSRGSMFVSLQLPHKGSHCPAEKGWAPFQAWAVAVQAIVYTHSNWLRQDSTFTAVLATVWSNNRPVALVYP